MQKYEGLPYTGRVQLLQRKYDVMKEAHVAVTIPAFFVRPLFRLELNGLHRYQTSSRADPEMVMRAQFVPEDKSMGLRSTYIPLILNYVEASLRQFEC